MAGQSVIGDLAARARQAARLGEEDELRRVAAYKRDRDMGAMDRLVDAHLGWIMSIAKTIPHGGEAADLIQEGVIGFMKAVEGFDPAHERRLNVYAKIFVRSAMTNFALENVSSVRVIGSRNHRKVFLQMRGTLSRDPDDRIMSDAETRRVAKALGVETEDVHHVINRYTGRDVSLDAPVRGVDGESAEFGQTIADAAPDPEERVLERDEMDRRSATVMRLLPELPERERDVLRARHLTDPPVPLEDLSATYGVTKQRIQQIERAAVERVRRLIADPPPPDRPSELPPPRKAAPTSPPPGFRRRGERPEEPTGEPADEAPRKRGPSLRG